MTAFAAKSRTLEGTIRVSGPIDEIFPLFSPVGEREWVPGWQPELLHPPGVAWEEGMVFRTQEELGPAVWMMTRLDHDTHRAEYVRVEPERYVARVGVHCVPADTQHVDVAVSYTFIGLSARGNNDIDAMNQEEYVAKLRLWQSRIAEHLHRSQST